MKRSLYLLALGVPFMLGVSLPPVNPVSQARPSNLVEVNVVDRFLRDTGLRKPERSADRAKSRPQNRSRASIPKPPALASVPLPIPKPAQQAQVSAEDQQHAAEQAQRTPPAATENPPSTEAPKPDVAQMPAAETPAKPPVVEQPGTATEPAREAEVPKPIEKPEIAKPEASEPAAADGKNASEPETAKPGDAKGGKPEEAPTEVKPDGKQSEDGKTEKAETPPPPPLVKEDPAELQACLADLKAIGAKFEQTDPINDGNGCGIENPIDVAQVLPGVDLGGATMRCKTALTMAHWLKDTVQPALTIAMPGRKIVGLVPGSTYQCRLRNSASTGKISEHARGNAYDVAAFKLDNGETMEMKPRTEDSTLEGAFQRTATAGACLHFTTVLSPGSDEAHEDHLHLDILERNGGYRYCR